MKTLMLIMFFITSAEGLPELTGQTSKAYEDLDACVFDLVTIQELNSRETWAMAACVEGEE